MDEDLGILKYSNPHPFDIKYLYRATTNRLAIIVAPLCQVMV